MIISDNFKTEDEQLLLAKLKIMYSESHRYYHNIEHIENLLKLFSTYYDKIVDKDAIFWTIWFHDCIYYPKNSDNEEQSAIIAKTELTKIFSKNTNNSVNDFNTNLINKIKFYILATKTHKNSKNDEDLQWFLDFDLSVLGAEPAIYDEYAANIRKEYAHIPTWKYSIGRRKVLSSFLAKDKIFEYLPAFYEKQARQNLTKEYKQLKWKLW